MRAEAAQQIQMAQVRVEQVKQQRIEEERLNGERCEFAKKVLAELIALVTQAISQQNVTPNSHQTC